MTGPRKRRADQFCVRGQIVQKRVTLTLLVRHFSCLQLYAYYLYEYGSVLSDELLNREWRRPRNPLDDIVDA
jgi:hypothetical protein